ncbi:hypothetical protein [Sphingomonas sp. LK11]|uniref:hypothetical protein n=1 Tax=Sphingomonas sp. LK11 TaxID=1390395 RepID=UPI0012EC2818|nr:hypothetical protein [Sphingomonas sp. LK11]
MADVSNDLVDGLKEAISLAMERLVNHYVLPAQIVLDPAEIAYVLMRVTANLACGGTLHSLMTKREDRSAEQICDMWIDSVSEMLRMARPSILAKYEAHLAETAKG